MATLRTGLLGCTATIALGVACPAMAQGPETRPAGPADTVEEVVVTGSLIARKDYTAESPIVTVGREDIDRMGVATVETSLNTLPQFTPSAGEQSPPSVLGPSGAGGRALLNLRGFGPARTLVLIDGRRAQPSDVQGSVDVNTISPALIENVEVITGGASAIYGSDAVAGVVNFRLKRNFEGLQVDAGYGMTSRSDGDNANLALTWGDRTDDGRASVVVSASYFERDQIFRKDRPFFDDSRGITASPLGVYVPSGANLPRQPVLTSIFTGYGTTSPTTSANLSGNADGTLFSSAAPAQNLRWAESSGLFVSPVTGAVFYRPPDGDPNTLASGLKRYTAFARGRYDLSDAVTIHGQVSYANYTVRTQSEGFFQATQDPIQVPVTNPFVPADLRTLLASRPRPNDPFTYYFITDRISPGLFRQEYDVLQGLAGAEGKLSFRDWTWNAHVSSGRTNLDDIADGEVSRAAFNTLINAPDGGASICAGGYRLFTSLDPVSEACKSYLLRRAVSTSRIEQRIAYASLQGSLFTLPAGDVRFAAGVNYRYNGYRYSPDPQFTNTTVLATGVIEGSKGSTEVSELFGEALVPLLRDMPLVRSLDLGLAYRFSDYDSVGGVHSYKGSLEWQVSRVLRLRGGYQRAIRAPSVGDLFAARSGFGASIGTTVSGGGDPCDGRSGYRTGAAGAQVRALCIATGVPAGLVDTLRFGGTAVLAYAVGNPDLQQEDADTITMGVVLQSPFTAPVLSRATVAVDYHRLELKGAIGAVTPAVSLQRCFNGDGASNPDYSATNVFCRNIFRDGSGALSFANQPTANLGGYIGSGLDVQIDWRILAEDVGLNPGWGGLSLNAVVSYVDKYKIQTLPGAPFLEYAGTIGNGQIDPSTISHPEIKTTTTLTYSRQRLRAGLTWRHIGSMSNAINVGTPSARAPGIKAVDYYDLFARLRLSDRLEVRGTVVNLLDKAPPVFTGQSATDPSVYDLIGRRYSVALTARF